MLGWLRDGRRRDYLWVVNRSLRQSRRTTLRLRASVREPGEVNQSDGLIQPVPYDASRRCLQISLLPREGRLFVLA